MRKNTPILYVVILCLVHPSFLPAEEIVIRGFVADSLTQKGVPDVNITVKDTEIGTTTETSGYFNLKLNNPNDRMLVGFNHIAYKEKRITLGHLKKQKKIVLVPENILLDEVHVEAKRPLAHYEQEIQNIISIYTEEKFEARGYTDAADVLNSDQSISIDENLNGTKQISVRGANENEILILYDGIKINSSYNNLFDLSMIDPTNLQQIDVIKGSNATIYGASGNASIPFP
ncbi:MAG: TonB-dependent receptor plug domain-containing protein [archaeon]